MTSSYTTRFILLALLSCHQASQAFVARQGYGLPSRLTFQVEHKQHASTVRYASSKVVESGKRRNKKELGFGKQAKGAKEQKPSGNAIDADVSAAPGQAAAATPWYADSDQDAESNPADPTVEEEIDANINEDESEIALVKDEVNEQAFAESESDVSAEGIDPEEPDKPTTEPLTEAAAEAPTVETEDEAIGSEANLSQDTEDSVSEEVSSLEMQATVEDYEKSENAVLEVESSSSGEPQTRDEAAEVAEYIAALEAKMRLLDEKIADILEVSDAVVQATQATQPPPAEDQQGAYTTSFAPDRPDVFLPVRPSTVQSSRMRTLKVDTPSFLTGESFINGSPPRPATSGSRVVPPPTPNPMTRTASGALKVDREDVFQPARPRSDVYMPGSPQSTAFSQARTGSMMDSSSGLAVDREDVFLPGTTHPGVHLPGSPARPAVNRNPNAIQSLPVDQPGFTTGEAFITGTPGSQTTTASSRVQPKSPLPFDRAEVLQPGTPHPNVYLPGSPQPATSNLNRNQQPLANEAIPVALSVDRPDVFEPIRPAAQSAKPSLSSQQLANDLSSKLRSIPMDTPGGSFSNGDALASGTPSRTAKTKPSPGADAPSFTADRPDVFLPASPRPADSKPSLTSQQLAANRPTLPVDTPSAFNPGPDWKK